MQQERVSPGNGSSPEGVGRTVRDLGTHAAELSAFVTYLLHARWDKIRLGVQRTMLSAALAVVAGIAAMTATITGIIFLLDGAARGIGQAAGGRPWVGSLVVGFLVLALLGAATAIVMRRVRSAFKRALVEKYERQRAQQRSRFGRDVQQAAGGLRRGVPR